MVASAAVAMPPFGSGVYSALTADRDNQYLMIDSTIVRAHQHAASGKGGPNQALGRSEED
jgi:hypothetical protein